MTDIFNFSFLSSCEGYLLVSSVGGKLLLLLFVVLSHVKSVWRHLLSFFWVGGGIFFVLKHYLRLFYRAFNILKVMITISFFVFSFLYHHKKYNRPKRAFYVNAFQIKSKNERKSDLTKTETEITMI
jgi:hypothetical protein